jgi:hypothetical protein
MTPAWFGIAVLSAMSIALGIGAARTADKDERRSSGLWSALSAAGAGSVVWGIFG